MKQEARIEFDLTNRYDAQVYEMILKLREVFYIEGLYEIDACIEGVLNNEKRRIENPREGCV